MLKKSIIKQNFENNGFAKISNLFSKDEISKTLKEINLIKNKFTKIKNPNLHLTKDNKINTIHDINKYINSSVLRKISKNKKLTDIITYILDGDVVIRNIEFFLKTKKNRKIFSCSSR